MPVGQQSRAALAIHGGRPVRETLLPYGRHQIEEEDIEAVVRVLRSDWLTTGPKVEEFEEAFAARVEARYAVSFSSGTAALHGAVFAAGLGAGDEAVTSPLTFCATANALLYQGATPVFADVSADTLNLDPELAARALGARAKAIVVVDFAGHPADLDPILELARARDLIVIEDAAHALGARYRDRPLGGLCPLTTFSLHPVKHVTTGEGGMVTCNDPELARRLRLARNHGIDGDARSRHAAGRWFYEQVALGYNYRLTDIGAALGLSQLKRLDLNLARRREIVAHYAESLSRRAELTLPSQREHARSAWHLYPVRLRLDMLRGNRSEILAALRAEGIGANVHYVPVHMHPYYRERFGDRAGLCPVAEAAYESLISLPLFPGMTDKDVADVVTAVDKVIDAYGA